MSEISELVSKIMVHEGIPFDWDIIELMEKEIEKSISK